MIVLYRKIDYILKILRVYVSIAYVKKFFISKYYGESAYKYLADAKLRLQRQYLLVTLGKPTEENIGEIKQEISKNESIIYCIKLLEKKYSKEPYITSDFDISIKNSATYMLLGWWPNCALKKTKRKIIESVKRYVIENSEVSHTPNTIPSKAFTNETVNEISKAIYTKAVYEKLNKIYDDIDSQSHLGKKVKYTSIDLNDALCYVREKVLLKAGIKDIYKGYFCMLKPILDILEKSRSYYKKNYRNNLISHAINLYVKNLKRAEKLLRIKLLINKKEESISAADIIINNKNLPCYKKISAFIKRLWAKATKPSPINEREFEQIIDYLGQKNKINFTEILFNVVNRIDNINHKYCYIFFSYRELTLESGKNLISFMRQQKSNNNSGLEVADIDCCIEILHEDLHLNIDTGYFISSITNEEKGMQGSSVNVNSNSSYINILQEAKNIEFEDTLEYWKLQAELRFSMAESLYMIGNYILAEICIVAAMHTIDKKCDASCAYILKKAVDLKSQIKCKFSPYIGSDIDAVECQSFHMPVIDTYLLQLDINFIVKKELGELASTCGYIKDHPCGNSFINYMADVFRSKLCAHEITYSASNGSKETLGAVIGASIGTILGASISGGSLATLGGLAGLGVGSYAGANLTGRDKKEEAKRELFHIIMTAIKNYNAIYTKQKQYESEIKSITANILKGASNEYSITKNLLGDVISTSSLMDFEFSDEGILEYYDVSAKKIVDILLSYTFEPDFIAYFIYVISSALLHGEINDFPKQTIYREAFILLNSIFDSNGELMLLANKKGGEVLENFKKLQQFALRDAIMIQIIYMDYYDSSSDSTDELITSLKAIETNVSFENTIDFIEDLLFLFGFRLENSHLCLFNFKAVYHNYFIRPDIYILEMYQQNDSILEAIKNNDIYRDDLARDIEGLILSNHIVINNELVSVDGCDKEKIERIDIEKTCSISDMKFYYSAWFSNDKLKQNKNKFGGDLIKHCKEFWLQKKYVSDVISKQLPLGINLLKLISMCLDKKLYIWHDVPEVKKFFLEYSNEESLASEELHVARDINKGFILLSVSELVDQGQLTVPVESTDTHRLNVR